ncbi:uncharacterized protein IL334_001432 [Kwoniella shivajii]|uniref:Ricin B lectin domain-containing protein n=1 Tax=Kwoniella shivajii TaxID=564305 RepID=A0ABZ1CS93_9TREE|nr:hypothetical protein IL334_001432 [Kwoniella shivajii]
MITPAIFITLISLLSLVTSSPVAKRYSAVKIRSARDNKCLSPFGNKWVAGTQVTIVDCTSAARWDINPGSGSIILHGSTFALDAGAGNANNELVKLGNSAPGSFAQTWYLTTDDRIAITGGTQCLDEGINAPQTYQCSSGNTNQVWIVDQ